MPELLEVEAYRRGAERAVGRRIAHVDAPDAWFVKGPAGPTELVAAATGRRVTAARRHGKLLLLDTDGPVIGLRFGMTGRLLVDGEAAIGALSYGPPRDDPGWHRFGLRFRDGGSLVITDARRLGGVELDPDESRLGPDAWGIRLAAVRTALDSRAPVKAVLLDQHRIAGLGNLLVDEVLYRSGIDPARPSESLSDVEVRALHRAITRVVPQLFRRGGSHMGDLEAAERRPGAQCPRDGAHLVRRTIGGRTTWSCPLHQR